MNRTLLATAAIALALATFHAESAPAQGVIVYGALQPEYQLGSFRYRPPMKDGWRQVTSDPTTMHLVYVESLGGDTLNTRADVVAEAFAIPDPALVPSGLHLTSSGLSQQMEQRGDSLVGYTRIEELDASLETHAYTLAVKLGDDKKRYETFFVAIAPDKSEYLVTKLTIDEEDYNTKGFFVEFYDSMKNLSHPAASDAEQTAADTEASKEEASEPPSTEAVPPVTEP